MWRETVSGSINVSTDGAYRSQYATSPYLKPMISKGEGAAMGRIMPRYAEGQTESKSNGG